MLTILNWEKYAVPQRRSLTGCIPTGYEMLIRAAGLSGLNFSTFQDEFDLDKNKNFIAGDLPENNFESVAALVKNTYPHINIESTRYITGAEKVRFIDEKLNRQQLVLISLTMIPLMGSGCHIMPVVASDESVYTLMYMMTLDRNIITMNIPRYMVEKIHNDYNTGRELAYLGV